MMIVFCSRNVCVKLLSSNKRKEKNLIALILLFQSNVKSFFSDSFVCKVHDSYSCVIIAD